MEVNSQFIEELKRNRDRAKEQFDACTKLLESLGFEGGAVRPPIPEAVGLRETVLSILKTEGPLSNREVCDRLKAEGYHLNGKTRLSTRVSIELFALKKQRKVKSEGDKFKAV